MDATSLVPASQEGLPWRKVTTEHVRQDDRIDESPLPRAQHRTDATTVTTTEHRAGEYRDEDDEYSDPADRGERGAA